MKGLEELKDKMPGLVPVSQWVSTMAEVLGNIGLERQNTLLGYAFCRDEVNESVVSALQDTWGQGFDLSGLAGYPAAGLTAFEAFMSHRYEDGKVLVAFGPHIGWDPQEGLGVIKRYGQADPSACCGALVKGVARQLEGQKPSFDEYDAEQFFVDSCLQKYRQDILDAPEQLWEATRIMAHEDYQTLCHMFNMSAEGCPVALIGGVTINCEQGHEDLFWPMFEEYSPAWIPKFK